MRLRSKRGAKPSLKALSKNRSADVGFPIKYAVFPIKWTFLTKNGKNSTGFGTNFPLIISES